jgi:hypothetical protein
MVYNAIDRLQGQIVDGELRLIQMVGVPRSVSTAIGRALNESGVSSIFVNEPFNREIREPEAAMGQVLDAAARVGKPHVGPGVVIMKNMASYVSSEAYEVLSRLSDATVWNVREPFIQIGSLVTRLVNDQLIGSGADRITQEQLTPEMVRYACDMLVRSSRSEGFSKTGWQSIGSHWRRGLDGGRAAVVDGGRLTVDPSRFLAALCQNIELPFSERMVAGWQQSYINVINRDNEAETARSAWTSKAAQSSGIRAVSRHSLDRSIMPVELLQHMTEVAVPTYHAMMKSHMAIR